MGFRGWKNLLAAEATAFRPLGKAGTREYGFAGSAEWLPAMGSGGRAARRKTELDLQNGAITIPKWNLISMKQNPGAIWKSTGLISPKLNHFGWIQTGLK